MQALANIEIRKDKKGYFVLFHKPSEMPLEFEGFKKKKSAAHALTLLEGDVYNWAGKSVYEITAGQCVLTQQDILKHRNSVVYTGRLVGGEIDMKTNNWKG